MTEELRVLLRALLLDRRVAPLLVAAGQGGQEGGVGVGVGIGVMCMCNSLLSALHVLPLRLGFAPSSH